MKIGILKDFAACGACAPKISPRKTKVMFTPPPGVPYKDRTILSENTKLGVVDTLPYLQSTISKDAAMNSNIFYPFRMQVLHLVN